MKDLSEEEQAFQTSEMLQSKLQKRYNHIMRSFAKRMAVFFALLILSLIMHHKIPCEITSNILGVFTVIVMPYMAFEVFNGMRFRRISCPKCGGKIIYRAHRIEGTEAFIGICSTCKIQGLTGMENVG